MRSIRGWAVLCCAAVLLSGCGMMSALMTPPAPPGSVAAPAAAVTPLGNTVVDEQAIDASYQALDVAATCADALLSLKKVVPGSKTALALADGLDTWRKWLNIANSARKAGNSTSAAAAFAEARDVARQVSAALLNK